MRRALFAVRKRLLAEVSVLGMLGVATATGSLALFSSSASRPAAAQEAAAEAEEPMRDPAAPQYDELKIPAALDERGKVKQEQAETRRRGTDLQRSVNEVLTGVKPLAENQRRVDGYYLQYLLPRLTWLENIENPANYNAVYQARFVFFRDFRRCGLPDVRLHILRTTLPKLKEITSGNFHPAARVNAMLIISDLNTREVVQTGTPVPPEPYADAFPVMVEALGDANQIDAVKVVAMLGIHRHIESDNRQRNPQNPNSRKIDAAQLDRANTLCLAILMAKDPPAGRTVEGHAWMQRRAIDVLGALGTIGTNVNATQAVDAMVADAKAPLSLRCSAAEALGELDLPPETRLEPISTAQKLGELAVYACQRELKRYADEKSFLEEKKKAAGGVAGGGMPGGPGGGMPGGMPGGPGGAMPGAMPGGMPGGPGGAMPGAMPGAFGDDGPGGGMPGMPGFGGAGGAAKKGVTIDDHRLSVAQRRIRSQMHAVKVGLAGVQGKTSGIQGLTKDAKQKELIQKLADEVKAIRDMSDDEQYKTLEKLMTDLKTKTTALEKTMRAVVALNKPADAAVPAADDGPGAAPPAKQPAAPMPPANAAAGS